MIRPTAGCVPEPHGSRELGSEAAAGLTRGGLVHRIPKQDVGLVPADDHVRIGIDLIGRGPAAVGPLDPNLSEVGQTQSEVHKANLS